MVILGFCLGNKVFGVDILGLLTKSLLKTFPGYFLVAGSMDDLLLWFFGIFQISIMDMNYFHDYRKIKYIYGSFE